MILHFDGEPELLELGHARGAARPLGSSPEIKVVSYNIRWRSGVVLHKLEDLVLDVPDFGGAEILGFQEVDRN
jgi:hypothetical protein